MMEIIRGTTPTLTLGLPFDMAEIDVGYVVIKQSGKAIIEKPFSECECKGGEIFVSLTQEETLKLSHCFRATIRLVVKTLIGERHESKAIVVYISDTSKGGVI